MKLHTTLLTLPVLVHCLLNTALSQTNQVLALNGTSAYATIPSSTNLQPSAAITVEAWIYPVTSTVHNPIFINKSDGQSVNSQRTYELTWPDGVLYFNLFLNQSTWAVVATPVASNRWIHVAATYDSIAGLLRLYTNGVLAVSTTNDASGTILLAGQTVRQTTQPLYFGVNLPVLQMDNDITWASGYLDEVRIWNTARTGAQIAANRFCRLTGTETNLMAYYNFDNGTVGDLTSNGNNGSLQGGAVVVPIVGQDTVHSGACGVFYFDTATLSFSKKEGFHEKLYGPSGLTLQVEASSDLTNWAPLVVLPDFSGAFEFNDLAATNFPRRFYRIVPQ